MTGKLIIGLCIYMGVISVITFFAFGIDKFKAKTDRWRIPEKTLISMMLAGGFIGGFLGMEVFRHKTKHPKFYAAALISAIIWGALIFALYKKFA